MCVCGGEERKGRRETGAVSLAPPPFVALLSRKTKAKKPIWQSCTENHDKTKGV